LFKEVIDAKEGGKYYRVIQKLFPYTTDSEFAIAKSEALMGRAQIEMFRAGEETDQAKAQARLIAAYGLIVRAVDNQFFYGLFLQQAKQLAAECLVRTAYIARDLDQASVPLALNSRPSTTYSDLMAVGKTLLESAVGWNNSFTATIKQERNGQAEAPLWLKQISAFASLWEAKVAMAEAGDFEADSEEARLAGQAALLDKAAGTLDELKILPAGVFDAKTAADIKVNRADNFARRGYRQLDEGNKQEAEKYFARAFALLQEALDCQKLHRSIRSAALKVRGDILTARKKLEEAEAEYTRAVETYPQNYDAWAGRADARSWQGKHDKAIEDYDLVIAKAKYPLLVKQAKLGRAEAEMRRGELYPEDKVKAFMEVVNDEIIGHVPRGSYLLPRAFRSLIEALGTDKSKYDELTKLITAVLTGKAGFTPTPRLRAELYLEQAKFVSWKEKNTEKKVRITEAKKLRIAEAKELLKTI
ncbi:MAG TPA: tetratricopeptide repeat protein, partial [Candidatus Sulfotelmatobacter sp.]|nr:tetratricopeptide repeat protein [Candidatus Sulfotelmatobacter sp.]